MKLLKRLSISIKDGSRFNRKTNNKIEKYKECGFRFDNDDKIINYIENNRHLLYGRQIDKNTLFYENNILKDDISNNTLVAGVFAYTSLNHELSECKGWNSLAEDYEPFALSLVNLAKIDVLKPLK